MDCWWGSGVRCLQWRRWVYDFMIKGLLDGCEKLGNPV